MKHYTKLDIDQMKKVFRLNLINSISGYKSANLIGSTGSKGENLAVFSSVIHLGSNPPLLGFIMRPTSVGRHTYSNILETGYFTINQIESSFIENAHYTSAKFADTESEFVECKLSSAYLDQFQAPYVEKSRLKMGMKFREEKHIEANGTRLIVGEIMHLYLDNQAIDENGQLDLNALDSVCISGLNRYHRASEIGHFPYARKNELPNLDRH